MSRPYPDYPINRDPVGTLETLLGHCDRVGVSQSHYWLSNRLSDGFLFIAAPAGAMFWHEIVYALRAADTNEGAANWAVYRAKIELMSWLESIR